MRLTKSGLGIASLTSLAATVIVLVASTICTIGALTDEAGWMGWGFFALISWAFLAVGILVTVILFTIWGVLHRRGGSRLGDVPAH